MKKTSTTLRLKTISDVEKMATRLAEMWPTDRESELNRLSDDDKEKIFLFSELQCLRRDLRYMQNVKRPRVTRAKDIAALSVKIAQIEQKIIDL